MKGVASAYANDIKYARNTITSNIEQIQQDIDIIYCWYDTMLTPLSIAKFLVLNSGNNNPLWVFVCNNTSLPVTHEIRNLGVTRISAQEFSANAALVAAKAYRTSGALFRSFRLRER